MNPESKLPGITPVSLEIENWCSFAESAIFLEVDHYFIYNKSKPNKWISKNIRIIQSDSDTFWRRKEI